MKILFKIIKAGSGNDIYFQRLAEALKEANIDSEIVYFPKYFQYFPFLLKFVDKRKDGDIIHSNVEYGWVFKEKNKQLVVTLLHSVFGKEYQSQTTFLQKLFHRFILKPNTIKSLKLADKRIAISEFTKKSFINDFGMYNITVIYPCLDIDKFKPLPIQSSDKRFKLLFVGNLTKRKGADLLPKIMKGLGKDFVLYYTSGLRTKIPNEFRLTNMVSLGKLSESKLIEEYNKCDALLFPSRLEGFGYSVAEAMACGKPVIASRSSSIPELVTDPLNGKLSAISSESFIKKIISIKKELRPSFKVANVAKVKREYSYRSINSKYITLLNL